MVAMDSQLAAEPVGTLKQLEVENFKSYRGLHIIGPFVNFTAVIGPNGSGKSNLMDAISFVCGVKAVQLRGSLEELLFSNSQSDLPEDHPTTGQVTLVFEKPDSTTMRFTRAIVPSVSAAGKTSYSSKYKVDDRNVTWDEFTKRLLVLGVNTKARNFLVFQGDIEKTAQKSPSELCSFLEIISGSGALKEDYDKLEEEAANAEAAVGRLYQKKKQLQQRKKATKAAKDEADKYNQERTELNEKKHEHYLWQLYHVRKDIEEVAGVRATHEERLAALHARRAAEAKKLSSSDKNLARVRKQRLALTRDLEKLQTEASKKKPNLLKIREFLNRKNKERTQRELMLKENRRKRDACSEKLAALQKDLDTSREALERAEAAVATSGAGDEIQLTPKLREEYQALKLKAAQESVESTRRLRLEQGVLKDDEAKLATERTTLTQMQSQHDRVTAEIEEYTTKLAALEEEKVALQREREAAEGAIRDIQAKNRRANTDRVHLRQQLDDIEARVASARSEHQQSRRERKMEEVVAKLVELYPNAVHGRLSSLVTISNRKHNVGISVLMGRNMDSVVVSTRAQATTCVQYLRDNRVEPMDFIPLDTVQVTPINGRMRALGGTAKLAIDLVEYDAGIEKALLSVFGNAVVCDSLDEARRLGHGPENLKVVSLDGTLIARDGKMSGGFSQSMMGRATRFDQKAADKLNAQRTELMEKLAMLPEERESVREESRLKEASNAVKVSLNQASVNADAARHKLQQKQTELRSLQGGLASKAPTVEKLQKAVDAKRAEVRALEAAINRVKDATFKAFSKKVGVKNVREYEEKIEGQLREREERLSRLSRHIAAMTTSTEFAERQLAELEIKVNADEEDLQLINKAREELEQQKAQQSTGSEALDAELAAKKAELAAVQAELDQVSTLSRGAKALEASFDKEEAAITRDVHKSEHAVTALAEKAAGIQQSALLDGVDLAVGPAGGLSDDGDGTGVPQELRLDYSRLSKQLKRTLDPDARVRTHDQFTSQIEELSGRLQQAVPNLKAPEEYTAILVEEAQLQQEVDGAKLGASDANAAFNEVRERRAELFNEAFAHISKTIDGVYKALTRSRVNSIGGTAYMSREDEDEPYKGGVNYCAIPPNKRFRDMEQLSGGEKTLAALALLLAVHSYRPSPFFVLDEVDAALDAGNLSRVANYIRQRTRPGCSNPFQGIIISLKDVFYEKADALIGVCRSAQHNASAIYTFNLEPFGPPQV